MHPYDHLEIQRAKFNDCIQKLLDEMSGPEIPFIALIYELSNNLISYRKALEEASITAISEVGDDYQKEAKELLGRMDFLIAHLVQYRRRHNIV